jgi:hypothetical protein
MPLGEVSRHEPPPLGPEEVRRSHVERERDQPHRRLLCIALQEGTGHQDAHAHGRAGREREDGVPQLGNAAARDHEQPDLPVADDRVGDRELECQAAERARHRQRDEQHAGHRAEDHDPDRVLLGIDDARDPRVTDPRPPKEREHEEALEQAAPVRVVRHELRALRQRQDEDEVEEELERRDLLALT